MGKYDVMTVAHWFLWRNEFAMNDKGAENLSLLQLMKLLYYAEGCYLALHNGEKLFDARLLRGGTVRQSKSFLMHMQTHMFFRFLSKTGRMGCQSPKRIRLCLSRYSMCSAPIPHGHCEIKALRKLHGSKQQTGDSA